MQHLGCNTLLLATLDLGESLGLERSEIHRAIGLGESEAELPGALVPSAAIIDAMEFAAAQTQRSDFGLLIAERRDHLNLGLFGLLIEQCGSVAEMHAYAKRFLHLHNSALDFQLMRGRSRGIMRVRIAARPQRAPRHYVEALLAMYVRMLGMVLGPRWQPLAVCFKHDQLAGRPAYARRFGPDVKFKQRFNGIVLKLGDLDREAPPRSMETKLKLESMLQELVARHAREPEARELPEEVARFARMLLPSSDGATIGRIAPLLKTSARSLQRKLLLSGTSFGKILAETRATMARDYLRKEGLAVSKLAPLLGFSQPSAVSRFLRTYAQTSARRLKRGTANLPR